MLQCARTKTLTASVLTRTVLPALASTSRARIHSTHLTRANSSSATNSIPDDVDAPLPRSAWATARDNNTSFESQKTRLLTSMDMLSQIQDAPTERQDSTPLDDQEAQYWARRMDRATQDLEQEQTRLRVAGKLFPKDRTLIAKGFCYSAPLTRLLRGIFSGWGVKRTGVYYGFVDAQRRRNPTICQGHWKGPSRPIWNQVSALGRRTRKH